MESSEEFGKLAVTITPSLAILRREMRTYDREETGSRSKRFAGKLGLGEMGRVYALRTNVYRV